VGIGAGTVVAILTFATDATVAGLNLPQA
jgi:hypothetical protein